MKKIILPFLFVLFSKIVIAQAFDSFNFSGALNANGWSTHSGTAGQIQTLSTNSDCQSSLYIEGVDPSFGNRFTLTAGNSEDVNKAINGITGTGYYSFFLKVTNTSGLSTTGDYFTGFGGTSGASVTIFAPRVYIKAGVTPNTFMVGVQNTTGGTPTQTYSGEYPVGTTVFVVVKLNATVSPIVASLFVNPLVGGAEPAPTVFNASGSNTFANFASIFFRQAGSVTSGTGNLQIDEIRVGTTWESVTPACQQILTWYLDSDADGFGSSASSIQSCCQPAGFVSNNSDCNDANSSVNPNTVWYADVDGDGYGDTNTSVTSCIAPNGYVLNYLDCNDNNLNQNLLVTYYLDGDFDGFGNVNVSISSCGQPAGYVLDSTDCDDNNQNINPNSIEIADNIDNNCDGTIDEGFALQTWFLDFDQDGFGGSDSILAVLSPGQNYVTTGGDCNDSISAINPNALEICDGIDNNCDGLIDNGLIFNTYYADIDGDLYGNINDSIVSCSQPQGYVLNNTDCDDANASINPGATDIPLNGIDEDCNGVDAPLQPINLGMYQFTGTVDCATQDNAVTTQPLGAVFSLFNGVGTNCAAAGGVFNRSGWNTTLSVDLAQYNEFSVVADDCKFLDLDRIAFKFRPSASAGSPIWHLRSNLDNYAADLDFGTGVNLNNAYLFDTVYLSNHTNLSQVTFRFYITEMLGSTTTWRMDDVSLFGNIMTLTPQTYYADFDGDGFGDPLYDSLSCSVPSNFTSDNNDCDDQNALINPNSIWYLDADNDMIGDSSITFVGCIPPNGYVLTYGDCDDSNNQISGATTYYIDADGDGFGSNSGSQILCQNPGNGYVTIGGDCDDNNDQIYPGATEICDGIDNNCAGGIDEGLNFITYYTDADNDGYGTGSGLILCENPGPGFSLNNSDCDDSNDQINPNGIEILDNGIDENCDGVDGILGISEINELSFELIPNPSSENTLVVISNPIVFGQLIVHDVNGKELHNINIVGLKTYNLDVNHLAPGIYLITLNSQSGKITQRLVKN